MQRPKHPLLWPVAGGIILAITVVGNELESPLLMVAPILIGLFIGLIQEWVHSQAEQQEAQDIKQAAQQARLAVVAGDNPARNESSLQGVVDPLAHANQQDAQANQKASLVVNPLEINRERRQKTGSTHHGKDFVPSVDLEGLQRVCHGSKHSNSKPVDPQRSAGKE